VQLFTFGDGDDEMLSIQLLIIPDSQPDPLLLFYPLLFPKNAPLYLGFLDTPTVRDVPESKKVKLVRPFEPSLSFFSFYFCMWAVLGSKCKLVFAASLWTEIRWG